jgi:Fur family ferric uptake transcriptional regulator
MKRKNAGEDLAKCGLRNTRQRVMVLDSLEKSEAPLVAEQIYLALKGGGASVSLSTVYRILEALCGAGIVIKLSIPGDPRAFFEYSRASHRHYLICLDCRQILALEHCPLGDYEKRIERETDYTVSGHRLVVYGRCPKCREEGGETDDSAPHS